MNYARHRAIIGVGVILNMIRKMICLTAVLCACGTVVAQSPDAAPAAADVTTTASPEVQQFQQIEDKWSTAVDTHDQYGLELVLSPLFVDVSADGNITTRDQQVALVLNTDDKTLHLEQKVIAVRMMGDIAVTTGTYDLHHRVGNSTVEEKGVFTHVYQRVRGGWMCTNSQRTSVRENAGNGKDKRNTPASAGFHFPIF